MPDKTSSIKESVISRSPDFTRNVERALRRAGRTARKVARMHGTPVYFVRDGKVVAVKP